MDVEWLTSDERLSRFSKDRYQIVGRVKGRELPSVQGIQYSEEDIVVRERVPIRTKRPSVIEPGTDGNHAPIGKENNDGYSANSK